MQYIFRLTIFRKKKEPHWWRRCALFFSLYHMDFEKIVTALIEFFCFLFWPNGRIKKWRDLMPSYDLRLEMKGGENLPSRQLLMKCTYLNPGSTGHSLNKQTANAQCSIFARSVIIIFKVRKKIFKSSKTIKNILRFQFNLFGNAVSNWLTISCFFVLQDRNDFCSFVTM